MPMNWFIIILIIIIIIIIILVVHILFCVILIRPFKKIPKNPESDSSISYDDSTVDVAFGWASGGGIG